MSNPIRHAASPDYLVTLLEYYEAEIMGEAYFYGLAEHFDESDKMDLLARIERDAARAVEPLLQKYGLESRDQAELERLGQDYVKLHQSHSWQEFMIYIVERYPGYLDEFKTLEAMAPAADLPALNLLTEHEVAVIDFAKKELAGDSDSLAPLMRYLE